MIVAGFGFRSGVTEASLHAALDGAVPDAVATLDSKAPALACLGHWVIAISAERLARQTTLTDSAASRAAHNTGSVAEAAALAALAPGARLLSPRIISPDGTVTVAFAEGDPA